MKKVLTKTLLLVSFFFMIQSCSDKKESDLAVTYLLRYKGQELSAFKEVEYALGYKVFFTRYSFYLTDLKLHSRNEEVNVTDLEYIDLLDRSVDAAQGVRRIYSGISQGTYDRISFNIGLTPSVNATTPARYAQDNPLSRTSEYWPGWASYIFYKIEGKLDADNSGGFETGIALHIGSDITMSPVDKSINLVLDQKGGGIRVIFDLDDVFNIDGEYYDLVSNPQVHSQETLPIVLPLIKNTATMLAVMPE